MWGVPEEETLSWHGEESRKEVKSLPAALAGSPSPPHPSSAIIHNPTPTPGPWPLCREGEGPAMSAPGDPRRAEWEEKQTHTHTHFPLIVRSNPEVLISQATEENREGSWPSKSPRSRGDRLGRD